MTSELVVDLMQRCDRAVILSHAIRHLLDHTDALWTPRHRGDADAIDLLMDAIDGPEPDCPNCAGDGVVPFSSSSDQEAECDECHGTGRLQ